MIQVIPSLAASVELGAEPRSVGTAQDAAAPASVPYIRLLRGLEALDVAGSALGIDAGTDSVTGRACCMLDGSICALFDGPLA